MKNSRKSVQKMNNKKHQTIYKMKGCSSSRKNKSGGNLSKVGSDYNLAYPYNGPVLPNTALAYTGKGGYKCPDSLNPTSSNVGMPVVTTSNVNGANPLYPNTGPPFNGFNFLNPVNQQSGGGCGCGALPFMGGSRSKSKKHYKIKHRQDCKCSACKNKKYKSVMKGGGGCSTSNNGIPYPNGLVGSPYVNSSNLPGANGIPGDANYYSNNTYNNDVSRQMIDVGANPPFLGFLGMKGGKRSGYHLDKTKKQRGGTFSNFISQDFINLGRQFGYGIGSTFNALNGIPSPINPMPWKGQLITK